MAARLTDRQKKQIIADYIEIGSYNAVAKMHGVSNHTVKRTVEAVPTLSAEIQHKKDQNTADILAHMETKKDKVNEIIDVYLNELLELENFSNITPTQLTTALGTLIDKFTMSKTIIAEREREDDPLTAALKEKAKELDNGNI